MAEKMGIMDKVLSKHLKALRKDYNENPAGFEEDCETLSDEMKRPPNPASKAQKSVQFRNKGNASFSKQDYIEAHMLYTQSIAFAVQNPHLSALAFANRSAVLLYMNRYEDCLKDIHRALESGYPENLQHKLYLREARCLKYLNRDFSASVEKAELLIEKHVKDSENFVTSEMNKPEPSNYDNKMPKSNDNWPLTLPTLSYGSNEKIPCFSSAVSVAENAAFGRHLVANRDIETADVLVVEKSLASAVALEVCLVFCSYCFKHCLSLIPCKDCGSVMYCDEECRDEDWMGTHKDSCFYTKNMYDGTYESKMTLPLPPGKIHSAAPTDCIQKRLISHFGMDNLRDIILNNKPINLNMERTTRSTKEEQRKADLEAFLYLDDNFDKQVPFEMRMYTMEALTETGTYQISKKDRLRMAAFFMKRILILNYNVKPILFSHYQHLGLRSVQIGFSQYLASSLINHSCYPNIQLISYGSTAVYRAMRPIKKGEQLTECYNDLYFHTREKMERMWLCLSIHKFSCRCEACEKSWPLLKMMPAISEKTAGMAEMLVEAGFDLQEIQLLKVMVMKMGYPTSPEMMASMVNLLKAMHDKDMKMNRWYFKLQESIQNYHKALGNVIFFDTPLKNLMMGVKYVQC